MLRGLRKKIFSVAMIAGIVLLLVGTISERVYNKFLENSDPTTGVISKIDTEDTQFLTGKPTVYVKYSVDKTKIGDAIKDLTDFAFLDNLVDSATKKISIETKLKYYDESMYEGQNVYLIYNTKAPKKVYIDNERTVISGTDAPADTFTSEKELDQVNKSAYYKGGLILFIGGLVLDLADAILTKKRQEKKMEKKIEKKMKKEEAKDAKKK